MIWAEYNVGAYSDYVLSNSLYKRPSWYSLSNGLEMLIKLHQYNNTYCTALFFK